MDDIFEIGIISVISRLAFSRSLLIEEAPRRLFPCESETYVEPGV